MVDAKEKLLLLYPSHTAVCGVGTWIDSLVTQLPALGWDVTVGLAWGRSFHDPARIEEHWPHWPTVRLDARTGTKTARHCAIVGAIRKSKPSVVVSTLLDDGLRVPTLFRGGSERPRFAIANHGNAPEHIAAILEASDTLDLVVSVNRASFEILKSGIGPLPGCPFLDYIPNAVPLASASHVPRTGPLRIGFIGRLAQDKGAQLLPEFVNEMAGLTMDFHLTIAGDGPERALIQTLAATNADRVTYIGPMSRHELYSSVYPQLDVVLCLSPSEGWPMGIAEAMTHGVVPVAFEFLGINQENVIRHEETGLIVPMQNTKAAVQAVSRLNDVGFWTELSRASSQMMQRDFTMKRLARSWDAALRSCLSSRTGFGDSIARHPIPLLHRFKDFFRRCLRLRLKHDTVRSEWPMMAPRDATLVSCAAEEFAKLRGPSAKKTNEAHRSGDKMP